MSVQVPVFNQTTSKPPKAAARIKESVGGSFDLSKFNDNFDALVEAVGGISAMRRLVLELAIRGRFSSSRPIGTSDTSSPFPVPDDWYWGHGEDLFTFVTSGSRGWAKYYADEGPIFLRIGNLDYETIDLDLSSLQHVQPPKNAEGVRTRVMPGDILISITGDTGMVGLAPSSLEEAYINQHIALARPSPKVIPEFIAWALTAPSLLGRLQGSQRGIKNSLGLEDVRRLNVPVPPLAEQERIVGKVYQLMALCDELEDRETKKRETGTRLTKAALEALVSADGPEEFSAACKRVVENFNVLVDRADKVAELRRAVLGLAVRGRLFGETVVGVGGERATSKPFELPARWCWKPLRELGRTQTGSTPSTQEDAFWGGDMPFVTPGDIEEPVIRPAVKSLSRAGTAKARPVASDSVLMVCIGGSLGKVGVVREPICCNQQINAITPGADVNVGFLAICLRSPYFQREAWSRAGQGTLPIVSKSKWEQIPVPVPPLDEQARLVAKVDQILATCDELEIRLREAEDRAAKLVEAVVQELVA